MTHMINGFGKMANECIRLIQRLDNTTNNIANVNTPGFKAAHLYFLKEYAGGSLGGAESIEDPLDVIDFAPGTYQQTGNVLDAAIKGDGFFAVKTKEGIAYTRDGSFAINANKELVTLEGDNVLGRGGKISITGSNIEITEQGVIKVDGSEVDTLKIVDFREPSKLVKYGKGLYQDLYNQAGQSDKEHPGIQSEYLEFSNVQPIKEMVEMINTQRSFETYQKTIQTLYEQDKMSVSRIGKLG